MRNYIVAAIIGISFIIAAWIAGNAFKYKSTTTEVITVTGSAEREFVSDLIVWSGTYSRKSMDLKAAYASLKADESRIRSYLQGKGIPESEVVFSSVDINREFQVRYDNQGNQSSSEFTGYNLSQKVKVESKNVDKVEVLSREITELIEAGIEFNSSAPSYYYTKLSELKIDLLSKASADARTRAESIADNSESSLGGVRKATMGVFQITARNSNEDYSYGGAFNTSSKHKTATITVRTEFGVR
ncbi:MAG: hypothetical protein K0Q66_641 [Chitinophagaceae bacterium]|jgi:hypothetical protein|nr:hypothetical protein [Chitinophagaceae bacterium]